MATEIRAARPDEWNQFGLIGAYVYGGAFGDGPDNVVSQGNRPEWSLCAFVDGRMATSYVSLPLTMRANGKALRFGGVSAVGTLPEYRRQGFLRRITTQSFADMRSRGESVAALWASQAAIYQRYGYALAASSVAYRIDTVDIGFADRNAGDQRIERIAAESGYDLIKTIYLAFVAQRTGYLHRAKPMWMNNALSTSVANGPAHIAVSYDDAGQPSGYVSYHLREGKTGHPSRNQELTVKDFAWLTADAYRSLWSFIARHDLVGRVVWARAPADDPAMELFTEPRLLNATVRDGIWLRIVDVQPAFQGRGYDADDSIKFSVTGDDLAPWNNGSYRLTCNAGAATVEPANGLTDLQLGVKALSSLFSGYRSARALRNFGLLEGNDRAIERATRLFATRYAPHCPDSF